MALRVVADVDEGLSRVSPDPDRVEEPARARALLVDLERDAGPAVAVAGRVRSPLGDRGHQSLRSEGGVDGDFRAFRLYPAIPHKAKFHYNNRPGPLGAPSLNTVVAPQGSID